MTRSRLPTAVLAIALAAFPVGAAAQDLGNDTCMACHREDARPVDAAVLGASAHAVRACVDCHSDVKDIPHDEKLGRVDCAKCHAAAGADFARSIHAELGRRNVPDTPTCATCHGTHDVYRKLDVRSRVNHLKIDAVCLKCHASPQLTGRHPDMASAEFVERYGSSIHGRAVHVMGLTVAATCSDCHGHHDMRPKKDPASTVHPNNIPNTCKACHLGIFESWKGSAHGKLWGNGNGGGPVCTTCHTAHDISDPTVGAFRVRAPVSCGGCHKEESATYRDTFHGKATSLGFAVAATCSDCHTPHKNLPKSDPDSTVHPARLVATCGRCHPAANASFVRFNPHLDPTSSAQSPTAHVVHMAMIWLLTGTFSFFGIHTLLWIQRSVVAVLRGEMPHEAADGKYVRRFSTFTIGVHVVVVVSFLILVMTGIPLRYYNSPWARAVVDFLGGIEVTRFFHRVCAILTFGYAVTHVGWLFHQVFVLRRGALLYGPESLTPNPKDAADLLQNLRWFLYLGRPPQFGRWTYFEKFDYFAVFWGVPIIGISGLMMWFPGFFTRLLPGDALNLAAIVHSEEALLAGGFIFTFHFFHNHLRPENFPMDTSIFTGLIPLERFIRERPLEYEALKKAGRENEIVVAPPTPAALLKARVFGFAALSLGIAVVVAVFAAYFSR